MRAIRRAMLLFATAKQVIKHLASVDAADLLAAQPLQMNPRTLWGCQPVAFLSCFRVTPPARFISARIASVLVPSRTRLSERLLTKRAPVGGDTEKLHLEGAMASGSGRGIGRSRDAGEKPRPRVWPIFA
ncbi:MAG: hypothetical protein ABSG41_28385 [Bryobacteraceae bacterium]